MNISCNKKTESGSDYNEIILTNEKSFQLKLGTNEILEINVENNGIKGIWESKMGVLTYVRTNNTLNQLQIMIVVKNEIPWDEFEPNLLHLCRPIDFRPRELTIITHYSWYLLQKHRLQPRLFYKSYIGKIYEAYETYEILVGFVIKERDEQFFCEELQPLMETANDIQRTWMLIALEQLYPILSIQQRHLIHQLLHNKVVKEIPFSSFKEEILYALIKMK